MNIFQMTTDKNDKRSKGWTNGLGKAASAGPIF